MSTSTTRPVRVFLFALLGLTFASITWLRPALPAHAADGLSWLALGDSYSSGEGTARTTEQRDTGNKDCHRSTGEIRYKTPSFANAWAVVAYEQVGQEKAITSQDFVACTGAIADDWYQQAEEAKFDSGREKWNIVSFSFGGNNVKFADIIKGCIGLPPATLGALTYRLPTSFVVTSTCPSWSSDSTC